MIEVKVESTNGKYKVLIGGNSLGYVNNIRECAELINDTYADTPIRDIPKELASLIKTSHPVIGTYEFEEEDGDWDVFRPEDKQTIDDILANGTPRDLAKLWKDNTAKNGGYKKGFDIDPITLNNLGDFSRFMVDSGVEDLSRYLGKVLLPKRY